MKKQLKSVALLFILLVSVFTGAGIGKVSAADATAYVITNVQVNDIDLDVGSDTNPVVHLERGETATVEVLLQGRGSYDQNAKGVDNVRVRAWLGGYEYGDVSDESDIFKVMPGQVYRKVLRINVPEDIRTSDYTLYVEAFDDDDRTKVTFKFDLAEQRHSLVIQDVIFNPGLEIDAGKTLFSSVRVENLGDKKEEDVKVVMSIPELGLSAKTYIDQLVTQDQEDKTVRDSEESSMSSDELWIKIPNDVKAGEYEVKIAIVYDRGHRTIEESFLLNVNGGQATTPTTQADTVITLDSVSQSVEAGKVAVYKVMIANLGNEAKTFSLEVGDVGSWGKARVDPAFVTVMPDQTAELFVAVTANEDAVEGSKAFIVNVKSGSTIVKQLNLQADVDGEAAVSDNYSNVRRGLEIGFIVLLIILVILGLIIAGKKLGNSGERKHEEMKSSETRSYY
ncbi:MAG TPA: hypothetical protein VJJ23_00710 [Candidatus Nanoarchaeia archaeon]|nr:hypothetical protein [Candidatus Nanoarchaeia archaeon]